MKPLPASVQSELDTLFNQVVDVAPVLRELTWPCDRKDAPKGSVIQEALAKELVTVHHWSQDQLRDLGNQLTAAGVSFNSNSKRDKIMIWAHPDGKQTGLFGKPCAPGLRLRTPAERAAFKLEQANQRKAELAAEQLEGAKLEAEVSIAMLAAEEQRVKATLADGAVAPGIAENPSEKLCEGCGTLQNVKGFCAVPGGIDEVCNGCWEKLVTAPVVVDGAASPKPLSLIHI